MRVIFLDFDGVLNNGRFLFNHMSDYPDLIMEEKVTLLNDLIERTDARIVFSTSWREEFTLEGLIEILEKVGFKHRDKCIGVTPIAEDNERTTEILEYVKNNNLDEFVVIDDNREEIQNIRSDNKFCTDPNDGLTAEGVAWLVGKFDVLTCIKEHKDEEEN